MSLAVLPLEACSVAHKHARGKARRLGDWDLAPTEGSPRRPPTGEVGGEAVLARLGVGRAREDEQDGCHKRQEADTLHAAMVVPRSVMCL